MTIKEYREKYKKRRRGLTMSYPVGGVDVMALCDIVEQLMSLIRYMQCKLTTEEQNEVEKRLLFIGKGGK